MKAVSYFKGTLKMRNSFHSIFCFHAEFWLASRPRASGTRAVGLVGSSLRVSVRCLWHGSLLGWLWTRVPERAKGRCSQPGCGRGPAVMPNGTPEGGSRAGRATKKCANAPLAFCHNYVFSGRNGRVRIFCYIFAHFFVAHSRSLSLRNRQARSHLPGRRVCLRPRVRSLLGSACLRRTGGSGTRTRGPRQ